MSEPDSTNTTPRQNRPDEQIDRPAGVTPETVTNPGEEQPEKTATQSGAARGSDETTPEQPDPEPKTSATIRPRITAASMAIVRFCADLLVVGLWTGFVMVLFLSMGWPGWTFYPLLLVGVGVYVTITSPWMSASAQD